MRRVTGTAAAVHLPLAIVIRKMVYTKTITQLRSVALSVLIRSAG